MKKLNKILINRSPEIEISWTDYRCRFCEKIIYNTRMDSREEIIKHLEKHIEK